MEPSISYKVTDNSIWLEKLQKLFKATAKKVQIPLLSTEILGFF